MVYCVVVIIVHFVVVLVAVSKESLVVIFVVVLVVTSVLLYLFTRFLSMVTLDIMVQLLWLWDLLKLVQCSRIVVVLCAFIATNLGMLEKIVLSGSVSMVNKVLVV